MQMRGYKNARWVCLGLKLKRKVPASDPLVDPGGLRADAVVTFGIVDENQPVCVREQGREVEGINGENTSASARSAVPRAVSI